MSFQITNAMRVTYQNNTDLLLQQKKPKLAMHATWGSYDGEKSKIRDQFGAVKPSRIRSRHADTTYGNTPSDGRWVAPTDPYYYSELVDKTDKYLVPGIDLTGTYSMVGAATMARAADDAFLEGYYGNAMTGKDGTTLVPFSPSNIIGVSVGSSGPTGLNIPKLRAARSQYVANLLDMEDEEFFVGLTSKQSDNLLAELQATSQDFVRSEVPTMMNGRLTKLLGFNFIECEFGNTSSFDNAPLTLDANNYRRVPTWAKSGMHMAEYMPVTTSIDVLPAKHYSAQVYARRDITATRTEENRDVQILCLEV